MKKHPPQTLGLRHVALKVRDLAISERFYVQILGLEVEWRPDEDNVYLTSGADNLALHRSDDVEASGQRLDHLGFVLKQPDDVDAWYEFLNDHGIPMQAAPRTHRDGARSFYCRDPEGNTVQMIYHPPLADHLCR